MSPSELSPESASPAQNLAGGGVPRRETADDLVGLLSPGVAVPASEAFRAGVSLHPPVRRQSSLLRTGLGFFAKAMVLLALAWGLVFNFSEVRGSSMMPGIHDRDRIVVDHVSYFVTDVSRGDIVVMRYPLDPTLDYIKRIVGLPGDEVVIAGGSVFVNGDELDEPYVEDASIEPWTALKTEVRPGHYFVLGDNRRRSSDSREFGQVPFEYLRGKVRFRLWPLSRIGMVR